MRRARGWTGPGLAGRPARPRGGDRDLLPRLRRARVRRGLLKALAVDAAARQALELARQRLDRLSLYSRPVRTARVRILVVPWLFRLPWFRRFDGYAAWWLILLRQPLAQTPDDLLCHELCHVW